MTFTATMEHVAQAFEWLGVLVLAVGSVCSFVVAGLSWGKHGNARQAYSLTRQLLGGTLLLGLEILVAADLVRTIASAPTLDNVFTLGLIVLIRTFLSFSLETEISGTPPWRRGLTSGAGTIARARESARQANHAGAPSAGPGG